MVDIGPIPAVAYRYSAALLGVLAEILERFGRGAPAAVCPPVLPFRDHGNGAIEPDGEDVFHRIEIGVAAVMQKERPVAADACRDHLACLGMFSDVARQREQRQRSFVVDRLRRPALGQARAFGTLALAALDIGTETAGAQRDLFAGVGVGAQHLGAVEAGLGAVLAPILAELARVAAFGIVGAADEGAITTELQGELSLAAFRTEPRVGPVLSRREDERSEL